MVSPRIGFQAYSPLRSYSGDGPELRSFLDKNGKDTDKGWGKKTNYTLWKLGFDAYEALGSPDRDALIKMRDGCLEAFPVLVEFLESGQKAGFITIVADMDVDDDGNPKQLEPTPIHEMGFDWLAYACAKALLSVIKAGAPTEILAELSVDFVDMLNYSILLAIDDALISYQLGQGSAFGDAVAEIVEMASLANEIKSRPLVEQKARKDVARNAAAAKLANDPKQAAKRDARRLWEDWQSGRTLHKSAAAFARYVVDTIPAIESEESVRRWGREWRKEPKSD